MHNIEMEEPSDSSEGMLSVKVKSVQGDEYYLDLNSDLLVRDMKSELKVICGHSGARNHEYS